MLGYRGGWLGGALAGLLCLPGCGTSSAPGGSSGGSGGNGTESGGTGLGEAGSMSGGSGGSGPDETPSRELTRAARLTHSQYQNTISDLFGIEEDLASSFAPDAQNGFSFDTNVNYVVDSRLAAQYRTAAELIAEALVSDDAIFSRIVPCDVEEATCPGEFVASFGLRAFRRPLTSTEQDRFASLFDAAAGVVQSGDAFTDGVSLVVETMLQSPDFLYRTELEPEAGDGRVPLSGFEIASRVSYFLYNSMPDEELLRAASEGELANAAEVRRQVQRLLDDERTLRRVVAFHEQAFDFGRYARIALDPETFPQVPSDLAARALVASRMFVEDVTTGGGGLEELLTAPYAFADSALAPLYDLEVEGDFERIDLDPEQRAGLLTQVGFLASHAYAKKTDPIHRGLFVVRNLLCQTIPDPPAGASMTPPPAGAPTPKTTREEIEILTGQTDCTGCHTIINPPGFAFEAFDAAGIYRTTEEDEPTDTRGSVQVDGQWVPFEGATDLMAAVATSADAQSCYLNQWLEFAHGWRLPATETEWVTELPTELSILELLPEIAAHSSFLTRPASEVSP